ncbi:MAG: hypothetical protein R3A78_08570 [Polyangiales bacterium]|nr:hypothetical protein [Myxococcales bacterium]
MPLDPEFVLDCPYGPGGLLLDDVLEVDRDASRVVVRWPTHDAMPITREQRAHPLFHPRHVSGGLMVHMTGMAGFAHAYYVFDLRHRDGWIGYGGAIHSARFKALAPPGDPIDIEVTCTKHRRTPKQILGRYDLRFHQNGKLVYEGDQTALWLRIDPNTPMPADAVNP